MRFLTYNIRHAEGYDGRVSPARIAGVLREAQADVVGMNEVLRIPRVYDQTERVARQLGMESVYQSNVRYGPIEAGNSVLTRGRIAETVHVNLPRGMERRGALVCHLDVDAVALTFVSTHLSLGRRKRAEQIEALASGLPRDSPLVLAGDFNCAACELDPLREFFTVLDDAPPTFPAVRPTRGLDHIVFSRHWRLSAMEAVRSLASDHLALWADLELV